ncbi:MAG: hypothetical protein QG655_2270 [Actinomycetota bacterium]|jgi:hypothetical protein|nr:hypothetical protein [Actinomycetota bacterium]
MTGATPGEIGYLVVGFSDPTQVRAGFDRLADLSGFDRPADLSAGGPMKVLDVEFIHSIHGVASTVPAGRVDHALRTLETLDSRLLGQADLDIVAATIPVGSTAAVVVYTGAPVLAVLAEWSRAGAAILREGRVDPAALEAARTSQPRAALLGG